MYGMKDCTMNMATKMGMEQPYNNEEHGIINTKTTSKNKK